MQKTGFRYFAVNGRCMHRRSQMRVLKFKGIGRPSSLLMAERSILPQLYNYKRAGPILRKEIQSFKINYKLYEVAETYSYLWLYAS